MSMRAKHTFFCHIRYCSQTPSFINCKWTGNNFTFCLLRPITDFIIGLWLSLGCPSTFISSVRHTGLSGTELPRPGVARLQAGLGDQGSHVLGVKGVKINLDFELWIMNMYFLEDGLLCVLFHKHSALTNAHSTYCQRLSRESHQLNTTYKAIIKSNLSISLISSLGADCIFQE